MERGRGTTPLSPAYAAGFGRRASSRAWRRASSCTTLAGRIGTFFGAGRRTTYRCRCISLPLDGWAPRGALLSEGAAGEVRDELRRRRVEADDVEHLRIVRVGDREAVRDHAHDHQACVDTRRLAVLPERL